jgi:SAM-dependent methyltransferase
MNTDVHQSTSTSRDFSRIAESERRELDAVLAGQDSRRWDSFFRDRAKPCPFFIEYPDESLAQWIEERRIPVGRVLDLGCGNARNAIFLARSGFAVEAVDYSRSAIEWAKECVSEAGATVSLINENVFELNLASDGYDFVYDSGCFHHIAPHRRTQYVDLVLRALKPGGWFGLTCFRPEGGSGYSDEEVYVHSSLGGGLGYTEEQLRNIWSRGMRIDVFRQMKKSSTDRSLFGETFLWVLLAQKTPSSGDEWTNRIRSST